MKGDKITLSQRQLQRFRVMSLVGAGKITLKEAAEKIGRSYRQAKQIWKRAKEQGVKGVIHGKAPYPVGAIHPLRLLISCQNRTPPFGDKYRRYDHDIVRLESSFCAGMLARR
jgi:transposase